MTTPRKQSSTNSMPCWRKVSRHARTRHCFAEMLSLPNDGRYPTLELAPQQRRQKTLEALTAQIEALSRRNPVLMIFEDAHWTDPTSLEVLGRIDRPDKNPWRVADRYVPARIRAAVDWAAARHRTHSQSAWASAKSLP